MFLCDKRELDLVTRQCLSIPCSLLGFSCLITNPITITIVCCSLRYKNNIGSSSGNSWAQNGVMPQVPVGNSFGGGQYN